MYNQRHHQFNSSYNHKFGFFISGPHQGAFDEVFRLKPKVVKTLEFNVDLTKRVREEIPDVFLIGRLFVTPQDFGQLSGGTAQAARQKGVEMADRILREEINRDVHHHNGQPIFNAWESLNEVLPESTDDNTQKLYDEYQVAFGQKMQAAGFEPIAFNFGQGNGRGQQWLDLYPGTLELYNYLGFHEYDWPTMDRLHNIGLNGPSEPHNLVPGVGQGRGNDGMWRCLRYRRIMNEGIRQKYGDQHTAIITECGMSQAVWGGSAHDIGPWANMVTVSPDIPGGIASSPIPADNYWQTLRWYNDELMKDDYVIGACLFVTGATGDVNWETFEHLGIITNRIFSFQEEVSIEPPPEPPEPPEPTEPVWEYKLETGPGLGLLVGDIGLGQVPITIDKPDGKREQVMSGSKPEFGVGGFETYAQAPGDYIVQFLDQSFTLTLTGQFTKVTFYKTDPGPTEPPPEPPEPTEPVWEYKLETGPGLGLLVGDIGLGQVPITIDKPDGKREQVMSGSKLEFGVGGFETYAQAPGNYTVQFLDQSFTLTLTGQFTKVTFYKTDPGPTEPPPEPPEPTEPVWEYKLETGPGLGLLVGDIGLAQVPITIDKPDGRREQVMSGSKPEFGVGGFETYAQAPGNYTVQFLDQSFTLTLTGQFTKVIFSQSTKPQTTVTKAPSPGAEIPAVSEPVAVSGDLAISEQSGTTSSVPVSSVTTTELSESLPPESPVAAPSTPLDSELVTESHASSPSEPPPVTPPTPPIDVSESPSPIQRIFQFLARLFGGG